MTDERQDSIRQGIGVPPESAVGREAARAKQAQAPVEPVEVSGMGGTSDAETAPDESRMNQALREAGEKATERKA